MADCYDNSRKADKVRKRPDKQTSNDYFYSEASGSDETSVDSLQLEWHQIREYYVDEQGHKAKRQKADPKGAKCDNRTCIINVSGNFALYLCYVCNLFLCGECLLKHDKTHEFVSVESETDERRRMAEMFLGRMRSERLGRGINFDREDVHVHGRVNLKHGLDKAECWITGLSGLENKKWVAVDYYNHCIKIFCSVSNTLLRYIKFGSPPWDVTEIKVKQKSTDPDSASGSKTDISGSARDEPDKHCLLAVTFPDKPEIWFININSTPTFIDKTRMYEQCWSIDFGEDKIFTLCEQAVEFGSIWSIDILSIEGNQLKKIPLSPIVDIPDLAVYNGRVYLSNRHNDKVLCINVEDGKTILELTLEGLNPRGISVDQNTGVVYVCGWGHNKVYKVSPDLREHEPLSLDTYYTEGPHMLCFINNKLYISHLSSLRHIVTVVQLLT